MRHEADQGIDAEDHARRRRGLTALAVYEGLDPERLGLQADRDGRSEGTERVEPLGACELPVLLLQIAGGDVVDAGIAQDELPRPGLRDVLGRPADDHAKLPFKI